MIGCYSKTSVRRPRGHTVFCKAFELNSIDRPTKRRNSKASVWPVWLTGLMLALATMLTLLFIPVLYALVSRDKALSSTAAEATV